ncbi:hypothetical protein [Bifidobacterium bombi]|uniref:hypothetical protein n=1 Tax=Bifidobacterium bombi TaxID=471511 RepID=UPI000693C01F|nr:hypothetical protein [Bifidobacterium bombi]
MEAALCEQYSPRDPIAEYWRGDITLRALAVLVRGLKPYNVLSLALARDEQKRQKQHRPEDDLDVQVRNELDSLSSRIIPGG